MINFDNDKFKGYLVDVKSQMKIMEEYRSNFFCKVCDVHQQKFFVLATKQILFSERQCMNMIENLEPMIKFLNIILLEYVDLLIEIKNCFDSDPRTTIHPIEGFLIKYKRRVPFFLKCFTNLTDGGGVDFLKVCWFLCKSFNWNKMSPVFEGDL